MSEKTGSSGTSGGLSRRAMLVGIGASGVAAVTGTASAGTASAGTASAAPRRGRAAKTIIVNGEVFSGTGARGSAVAVGRDGRIIAVGSTREIRRYQGQHTEVVDAEGGTIMAGIRDGHVHPLGAAEGALNPSLGNASLTVTELQGALQAMLDASSASEPDGWLQATDWNPVGLLPKGTETNKVILDALSTSRPIFLQGSDFHNAWVNSKALTVAGITKTTPNPPGGEIVRDGSGEATGLLKDSAQGLVSRVIPPPSAAAIDASRAAVATMMLAQGITSFMDAACGEDSVKAWADLLSRGVFHQRVVPALVVDSELAKTPQRALHYLAGIRRRHQGHPGLHLGTAKVFMDGVIEYPAQTAALLRPYLDADGRPTKNRGDLYVSNKTFKDLAVVLDRAGWQMHCHSIGDRAARTALNGFEAARRRNGGAGHRHTITHLQLVDPHDFPRFAKLSVLASMQLQWAVRDIWTVDALRPFIGNDRFRFMYPAGSLARRGARLVGGSDWPVDPLLTFNQIATAIDRSGPYADYDKPLNRSEGISRLQSLLMHTRGGAYQLGERRSGTVAPGQQADLVVMDRDVTRGSVGKLRRATVEHTLIGGRVVYSADSAAGRSAARTAGAVAAVARLNAAAPGTPKPCCGGGH